VVLFLSVLVQERIDMVQSGLRCPTMVRRMCCGAPATASDTC